MGPIDTKVLYNNLLRKGFKEATNKSRDHKWIEFWYKGKLTKIRTKVSHGEKEIGDRLISFMSRQTYLSNNQFREFALCNITELQYIEILKKKMIVSK